MEAMFQVNTCRRNSVYFTLGSSTALGLRELAVLALEEEEEEGGRGGSWLLRRSLPSGSELESEASS